MGDGNQGGGLWQPYSRFRDLISGGKNQEMLGTFSKREHLIHALNFNFLCKGYSSFNKMLATQT